jgi:pyruvate dehydrogenase (quinone)
MAKKIASELLVERLVAWGVETVFGLPGDGINGIMEGFRRHRDRIRFVLVHHEEAAAFMATGHAKATGKLGVCLATSGPGGIHLLNGLYDAKLDHAPVLAITGMQAAKLLGTGFQQEVDLDRLFIDVAEYNAMLHVPVSIPALVDNAVRTSLSRRTVSHLTFPVDLQEAPADADPWQGGLATGRTPATSPVYIPPPELPRQADLQRAANVLNQGERVAMLVGQGALGARDEVLAVADTLGSPIIKSLLGKAVVADDHPLTTGGLGLLGTRPSEEAIGGCDTLFMVGTSFPYTAFLPEAGSVRCVQIDSDPVRAGNRMPTDVPLVGDAKQTLAALLPLLGRKGDRRFAERAQAGMAEWRREMAALEDPGREPIQPEYLAVTLDRLASEDAIMTTDSGTVTTWAARHWQVRAGREFHVSGNLATMAPGLPYAIAVQFANPGRQVIAFVGDGGFTMLMAEFLTACRYELPVKVVVCNNGLLGQILWEQMALGYPEHGVRWERHADFAPWAQASGGLGVRVTKPGDLEGAVADILAHDGPALLDVVVNPDEPPMPARVRADQAKGFMQAMLRGEPRRVEMFRTILAGQLDRFSR